MGRPTTYNDSDVERWLRAYNEGMTHEEIANQEGILSYATVGRALRCHPDYVARTPHQGAGSPKHGLDNQGTRGSKIKSATLFPTARGHRRRSRY